MNLRDTLQRLDSREFEQAVTWYNALREPEKDRVKETLDVLLEYRLDLSYREDSEYHFAVIVAGSSIDTDTYGDIDLFLLTAKPLHQMDTDDYFRGNPHHTLKVELNPKYNHGKLPKYAYFVHYRKTDLSNEPSEAQLLERGLGARVTVSLLYELEDFDARREDHPDDLILPEWPMGAEELIAYNRERDSKFLVLARQYDPLAV